jgi:hypothetical protein
MRGLLPESRLHRLGTPKSQLFQLFRIAPLIHSLPALNLSRHLPMYSHNIPKLLHP